MEQPLETEDVSQETEETENQKTSASMSVAILVGVGLAIAFAVGLVAGFIMRPMVVKDIPVQVVVTVVPPPVSEVAQVPTPTASPAEAVLPPTGETPPTTEPTMDPNATATPTIMEFVLSDARHFQGSDGAPVTVVEFSDFK